MTRWLCLGRTRWRCGCAGICGLMACWKQTRTNSGRIHFTRQRLPWGVYRPRRLMRECGPKLSRDPPKRFPPTRTRRWVQRPTRNSGGDGKLGPANPARTGVGLVRRHVASGSDDDRGRMVGGTDARVLVLSAYVSCPAGPGSSLCASGRVHRQGIAAGLRFTSGQSTFSRHQSLSVLIFTAYRHG